MGEFEFSQTAQHWVNVTLIWIGLGTLAGLAARAILPGRDPGGAVATLVLGITGSVIGLWALSLVATQFWSQQPLNPISPLGLLAAAAGAFLLLTAYRVMAATLLSQPEEEAE